MALKWIRKVAATPLNTIAKVINSFNTLDEPTTNAPSIQVVKDALAAKQNSLTFDDNPTSGSSNPVTSGGVYTALSGKQDTVTGGATTITGSNLTASRALVSNSSGKVAVSDVTSTELGYLDGVTSAIQTQLNGKQATITGGATTIATSNLTASRALISNTSGKVAVSAATSTELGYLSGVTSAIQTQLNGKQATLTFDSTPTSGSSKPVTSAGIYTALNNLVKKDSIILASAPSVAAGVNIVLMYFEGNVANKLKSCYGISNVDIDAIALLGCTWASYSNNQTMAYIVTANSSGSAKTLSIGTYFDILYV